MDTALEKWTLLWKTGPKMGVLLAWLLFTDWLRRIGPKERSNKIHAKKL